MSAVFKHVLTVAAKSLQPDRIVHGVEQQPCGVQVVEWVGLVYLLLIRGKPDGSIIGIPEGEG